MRGTIHIKNMKMEAGKQYVVKYFDGKTLTDDVKKKEIFTRVEMYF